MIYFFFLYLFGQKYMCYACFKLIGGWEGRKNLRAGIFWNKNLLGSRKQTTFFSGLIILHLEWSSSACMLNI